MFTTSIGMSIRADLERRLELERHADQKRADDDPEGPAARQHGDHDGDEPGAVRHERLEGAGADDGEVGAAEAAERAGGEHRPRAGREDAHAGGVERGRLVAGGRRLRPGCVERNSHQVKTTRPSAQVDDEVLLEQAAADAPGSRIEHGDRDLLDARRAAGARVRIGPVQQARQSLGRERQGDADHDLVEPEPDAEHRHEQGDEDPGADAAQEADPDEAGVESGDEADVAAEEHHPLEADVQHAGPLRDRLAEPGEQQRHAGEETARKERRQEGLGEDVTHRPPSS